MNLHKQNFVCWPSVGPQDIKQTYIHTYIHTLNFIVVQHEERRKGPDLYPQDDHFLAR